MVEMLIGVPKGRVDYKPEFFHSTFRPPALVTNSVGRCFACLYRAGTRFVSKPE